LCEHRIRLFRVLSATQSGRKGISLLMMVRSAAASSGPTIRARKPGSSDRSMATAELRAMAVTPVMTSTVSFVASRLETGGRSATFASASRPRSVSPARPARTVSGHAPASNRLSTGVCPSTGIARRVTFSRSNGTRASPIRSPHTAASTSSASTGMTFSPGSPSRVASRGTSSSPA